VIYNNTFDESKKTFSWGAIHTPIQMVEYRASQWEGTSTTCSSSCSTAQWCNATNGEGYLCCDQIGAGKNQASEPLYFWNNTDHNGNPAAINVETGSANYIKSGRDYFVASKVGYSPYTYPHPLTKSAWGTTYIIETYDHATGWVLEAGKTYTYSMTVKSAFIGKEVTKALQGTALYSAVTNAALVESTAGSYYYDATAGKLYVRCTNNVNPNNYLITAYFKD
jgi:hypothetical protein